MQNTFNSIRSTLESIENLSDCDLVPLEESQRGEGVIAVINRVVLTGTDAHNEVRKRNLILKTAPNHQVYRNSSPIHDMYANEIYAYETVLPKLKQTFEDFDLKFVNIPKCYATNLEENHEYLILEDLKIEGYKLWVKQRTMDDDHIHLVLENLAKFHAASIYLKSKCVEVWEKLISGFNNVQKKFYRDTEFCEAVVDLAETLEPLFENGTLEMFRKFRDEEVTTFLREVCNTTDADSVIVHGDLWCNNIMFKYKDHQPIDLAFLDYQAVRLSSIAVDLSYFLYVSGSKDVMSNIDIYLEYYYDKLSRNLHEIGLDPHVNFPKTCMLNQWRKYNKYGLCMALVTLHGVNSDSDEFPNLDEVMANEKGFWFALNFKSRHESRYRQRIRDVILHFVEKGYIAMPDT